MKQQSIIVALLVGTFTARPASAQSVPDSSLPVFAITVGLGAGHGELGQGDALRVFLSGDLDLRGYSSEGHGVALRFAGYNGWGAYDGSLFQLRYSYRLASQQDPGRGTSASLLLDVGVGYGEASISSRTPEAACIQQASGWSILSGGSSAPSSRGCNYRESGQTFSGVAAISGNLHFSGFTLGLEAGLVGGGVFGPRYTVVDMPSRGVTTPPIGNGTLLMGYVNLRLGTTFSF